MSQHHSRARSTRLVTAAAIGALALGGPIVAASETAQAAPAKATSVKAATTHAVNARKAPHLNAGVVRNLPAGTTVSLACHTTGDSVFSQYSQQNTNLWNYSPDVDAFISDGYLNTGVNGPASGLPECQNVPGKPADPKPKDPAPAKGSLVPVRQGQGQDYQWFDCGPASLVMVAHAMGKIPHAWDPKAQVPSILQARQDMGYVPTPPDRLGTHSSQAVAGLATYGLKGQPSTDVNAVLAHVRSGRPAILMGEVQAIPWPENVATTAPILHWIVVAGYDAKADEYLVLDPANSLEANTVHRAKASFLQRYNAQNPGEGGVLVS